MVISGQWSTSPGTAPNLVASFEREEPMNTQTTTSPRPETAHETLTRNVRVRLAHMGSNLSEECRRVGESQRNLSAWLRAGGNPTLSSLTRLAKMLGVQEHKLLDPGWDGR